MQQKSCHISLIKLTKLRENTWRSSSVIIDDDSRLDRSNELLCVHLLLTAAYSYLHQQPLTI